MAMTSPTSTQTTEQSTPQGANSTGLQGTSPTSAPVQEPPSLSFRMLQVAVWGMGALLFFGVMGLAYTVVSKSDKAQDVETATPVAPRVLEAFDPGTLPLPAGARIEDMALDGNTLVLRLTWSDGVGAETASGTILWFYDLKRQAVVGELRVP